MSTLAWPERQLRPGERFETHAKFEPYVEAVVKQFLLGQVPYKHKSAVLKELSERSHDSKVWTSERISYCIKKGHAALSAPPSSKRAAVTSPSDSNITEGFAVGTDDSVPLDMTTFDDEPNPLGGRPKGTDSASRFRTYFRTYFQIRSTKFDVLSAWTQNGVDKIDIRKSIISLRKSIIRSTKFEK